MSNPETELLRESIDRLTQHEQLPAGLADRAFQHQRQRRTALRAAAAGGTAVLAAAGVFTAMAIGAGPGAAPGLASGKAHHAGSGPPVQTTAYVSGRAERALATAERANLVERTHTVAHHYPLGLTLVRVFREHGHVYKLVVQSGATAASEDSWYYHGQLREQGADAAGRTLFDASSTTTTSPSGHTSLVSISGTGVDYTRKTWWHAAAQLNLPAPPKSRCKSAYLPPPAGTPVNWAAEIRAGLSCGHYKIAGHEQAGSVRAIKLVSVKLNGPYSETLLVNPVSYLPMGMTYHWLDHRAGGPGSLTATFAWEQPTAANLGALRVTPPAGFRQTSGGGLPVPGLNL